MDNDQIKAALTAKHTPGALIKRISGGNRITAMLAGDRLPATVRTLVEQVANAPDHSRAYVIARERLIHAQSLERLSDEDWARAASALLPRLEQSVTSALGALSRRPFLEGAARRPFRAPRSRRTLAGSRARWLASTVLLLGDYDADIVWVAEHAAHLASWFGAVDLGWLLAGAIDAGGGAGDAVFDVLAATVRGEHETSQMGRHVTQALLSCSRPEAWALVERLLLAAQREEGLRQVILESVDDAHPGAFRHLLRVVRDHGLSRFTSVVRAADVWFGFLWDGSSAVKIDSLIERTLLVLDDRQARAAALSGDDAESAYLALWSAGFDDVESAIPLAVPLLTSSSVEIRFVATHFLAQASWSSATSALVDMLTDADLRVAARALDVFHTDVTEAVGTSRHFDRLEQLMARLPSRGQRLEPLVWPWWKRTLERSHVANAMLANESAAPGERLLPHIPDLEPGARAAFLRRAALGHRGMLRGEKPGRRALTAGERTVALELLGDASAQVRDAAFEALAPSSLEADEVDRLITLLDRKPGDLRSRSLDRLRSLSDAKLLDAADRLLADASEPRREAGLELLRDAMEKQRSLAAVRARIERYTADHATLSKVEEAHVVAVLRDEADVPAAHDAFGLIDPSALRAWPDPTRRTVDVDTPGARAALASLAELALANAETEVRKSNGEVVLLPQAVTWGCSPRSREDVEGGGAALPLRDLWHAWVRDRPASMRDVDGLELLRALVPSDESAVWTSASVQKLRDGNIRRVEAGLLRPVLEWGVVWEPPARGFEFLLDGLETSIAELDDADYRELVATETASEVFVGAWGQKERPFQQKLKRVRMWLIRARWWRTLFPKTVRSNDTERVYGLLRALDARSCGRAGMPATAWDFLNAYEAGALGDPTVELTDLLVGRWSAASGADMLRAVSPRRPPRELQERAELLEIVDRCRRRVVEVETARGDRRTAASVHAMALRWTGGLDTISRALPALGKTHFARNFGWARAGASRQEVLSHLVVRSFPRPEDTPEAFAAWAREARVSRARLVELAVYAPQWAGHVNHVLQWPGLEDGVWWIEAHTKDGRSWKLRDLEGDWAAAVSERTPLSSDDLKEGAVDVAWFGTVYAALGEERWKSLDAAAKYAASSGGHTRARLFARAMAGTATRQELLSRIDTSRHQDSVRALGLLPLAAGDAGKKDLLERYVRLEEFRRESRKFGSQRQQSERRAAAIGLANLARTAGYRDPQRLQWAMEQQAVADLTRGPLVVERGGVTLALAIDGDGVPSLTVTKGGKALKALPAALKKDEEARGLKDRLQDLKRQRSRVRGALEEAMCRGDTFRASELRTLLEHPILAPSIQHLVMIGDGTAGYPAEQGKVLTDHAGVRHVLGRDEEVRIAHPHDLFDRGDWAAWQRECFAAERVQPFKQVFRELYPITEGERGTERSKRYAGHQVNPRQAASLLGARGWLATPGEGMSRTFHDAGLTARIGFQDTLFTPAEIEGLTLEDVVFTKKGDWTLLPLSDVPRRAFSETMRDLDLVVSVAHRGGVDPEATASTVEMRAALVKETCQLMGLDNVELQQHHAIVRGELGTYSVHLGSAGVMLIPATAIPIVAVQSQHRGRFFLPFADDDPRTAEVLSKVLLLARDRAIRDPSILDRIRSAAGTVRRR